MKIAPNCFSQVVKISPGEIPIAPDVPDARAQTARCAIAAYPLSRPLLSTPQICRERERALAEALRGVRTRDVQMSRPHRSLALYPAELAGQNTKHNSLSNIRKLCYNKIQKRFSIRCPNLAIHTSQATFL